MPFKLFPNRKLSKTGIGKGHKLNDGLKMSGFPEKSFERSGLNLHYYRTAMIQRKSSKFSNECVSLESLRAVIDADRSVEGHSSRFKSSNVRRYSAFETENYVPSVREAEGT